MRKSGQWLQADQLQFGCGLTPRFPWMQACSSRGSVGGPLTYGTDWKVSGLAPPHHSSFLSHRTQLTDSTMVPFIKRQLSRGHSPEPPPWCMNFQPPRLIKMHLHLYPGPCASTNSKLIPNPCAKRWPQTSCLTEKLIQKVHRLSVVQMKTKRLEANIKANLG